MFTVWWLHNAEVLMKSLPSFSARLSFIPSSMNLLKLIAYHHESMFTFAKSSDLRLSISMSSKIYYNLTFCGYFNTSNAFYSLVRLLINILISIVPSPALNHSSHYTSALNRSSK
jgi:hypothetical protein